MYSFIKNKLNESIVFEMLNQMIDEDYPSNFNMEHFKTLNSFASRVKYCNENLQRLASGDGRNRRNIIPMDKNMVDSMWENEFMTGMFDFIGNYSLPTGDLVRTNSYGLVKRNGEDSIIMIDYGLTKEVYDSYYS